MTREWNAAAYHKVSGPQTSWGQQVLDRLTVKGNECVIDAGCGSGRLTGELMERLPQGRIVALDGSWNMLMTARANLRPAFGDRVAFVQIALPQLPFAESVDLVFSTATFHWVRDHAALFRNIYRTLKPGGRLVAQCGGGPNLAQAHRLAEQVMRRPRFAPHFASWTGIWEFASAETTAERLRGAGFDDIATSIEPATTGFSVEADYREFVSTVIYHPHMAMLPTEDLKQAFLDGVTELARRDTPPFTLDYWRLNMAGVRP
ncbi:MAG: class I SAM-dependent methyltransferase [Bryobacteraceae bacterium]